jgi:hypothetical protein
VTLVVDAELGVALDESHPVRLRDRMVLSLKPIVCSRYVEFIAHDDHGLLGPSNTELSGEGRATLAIADLVRFNSLLGVCVSTLEPVSRECAVQQCSDRNESAHQGEQREKVKETLPQRLASVISLADQFSSRFASKIDSRPSEHEPAPANQRCRGPRERQPGEKIVPEPHTEDEERDANQ